MILLCERCMNGLSMPDISSILKMAGSWCDCQACVVFPGIVKGSLDEGLAMRVDLRFLHGAMRQGLSCKKHRFCDRFCERRWSQHFCRVVHCRGLACMVSGSGSVLSKSLTAQQDSQTAHRKIRMQLSMPHCWQGWLAFVQRLQEPQNLRNGWI